MATVMVTGANRGLGLEFVRQYSEAGHDVIACCRGSSTAEALNQLAQQQSSISIYPLDVTQVESIAELVSQLQAKPIDILINNAGIFGEVGERFGSVHPDTMQQVFLTNTMGPLKLSEALVDNIANSELKTIVAISSGAGSISANTLGRMYSYRASKAALNAIMQSMAIDLAPQGIKVLSFCPGWVRTDMGGEKAPLSAADSVSGIRQVMADEVRLPAPGFYRYDGQMIAW